MTVITASRATFDARYAAVITRHPTHSEQPAAAVDDGDQDAHTTRGRPPPERARRSTAALRSVDADDFGVVDEAVDHGGGHDVVAEHFAPTAEGFVGGNDQAGPFVARR